MCPVIEKYILNEYINTQTGKPVKIGTDIKKKLIQKFAKSLDYISGE